MTSQRRAKKWSITLYCRQHYTIYYTYFRFNETIDLSRIII